MAIQKKADQLLYKSRGPLDAKSLVKAYADLVNVETWTYDDILVAYNGMIVAVYLDKVSAENNGIYYLFDPNVTKITHKPDVTNEANWHKLAGIDGLVDKLSALDVRLTALEEQESDVITYGYRSGFPAEGESNKLYIAADEGKSYIWFNGEYLPVRGGESYEEPDVIYGGSAD